MAATTTYNVNITVTGKDAASGPIGNVSSALNTLAGVAGGVLVAQALSQVASTITSVGREAVNAAADMQRFQISLETLTAREAVQSGAFKNIGEALGSVSEVTADLMDRLKQLSLISPFTFDTVYNTFRTQMAFGATADMSIKLTAAILDTASALGLTGEATDRMAYNFAQINSIGKLMAVDLRQLRMVGLDLADVMERQLGLSIDEVNQKLETGELTMRDVSEAFVKYAETNFAGAAQRMSLTFQGLQSSFHDLFFFMSTDMLGASLETVTGKLTEFFQTARDLQQSGYFTQIGTEISANVDRIMQVFQDLLGADGPEGVLKKLAEGLVSVSDTIADVLEWYNGLSSAQKGMLGDVAKLILIFPLAVTAFTTLNSVVSAANVIWTAFQAHAAGIAAVMGPLAITLGAAALAWNAYKNMQAEATEGQKNASEGWNAFFTNLTKTSTTAAATLETYRRKQAEINSIIENANPIVRAIVQSKMKEINTTEQLANAILMTSVNYGEYTTVMQDAGLMLMGLTESEYNQARGIDQKREHVRGAAFEIKNYGDQVKSATDAVELAKQAEAQYKAGLDDLKYAIADALGNEYKQYEDKLGDLKTKQAEVNAKIDELEGKSYLTSAQKTELSDLYTQQSNINDEIIEMGKEHELATAKIIFDLAATKLAMTDMDPTVQLAILQNFASQLGLTQTAGAEANIAVQTLIASTNTANANNLGTALAFIAKASADGHVSAEDLNTALDILNGKIITTQVITYFDEVYSGNPTEGVYYEKHLPQEQALGGDYLVTRPTLFMAGESGDEEVWSFSPRNGLGEQGDRGGNTTITIINRDRAAAALSLAYVDIARNKRLTNELGRL